MSDEIPFGLGALFRASFVTRGIIVMQIMVCCASAEPEEELPLPRWSEEELRLFQEQRQGVPELDALLPDAPGYLENLDQALREPLARSGPRLDDLPSTLSGEIIPRLRVQDLLSFLPDASKEEVRHALPTARTPLQETTDEFLRSAARSPEDRYLIDPATLLPEMAAMEIERLLEFHASEARIGLFVLVIGKNEKLPASADLDSIASGKLVSSDACLVVYPLAEPWRARLLVSRTIHEKASPLFLSETAGECVRQALVATEAGDQLERFVTTLSPRLFWLQNALGKPASNSKPSSTLREFAGGEGMMTSPPTTSVENPRSDTTWSLPALSLTGAALTGLVLGGLWAGRNWIHRRRARSQTSIWLLPETEVQPRLGGAFCGGTGLVMRYR